MLQSHGVGWKTRLVLAVGVILAVVFPAGALASEGGLTPVGMTVDSGEPATEETPTPGSLECTISPETGLRGCLPVTPAEFVLGVAAPPEAAPPAVKAAIAAANLIRTRPYIWGGGHARWWMPGYDCSGAVSFALYGAGLLDSPLTSGSLESYGEPGPGKWITIYANAEHTYMVIGGLRWDTVGDANGTGPRWHAEPPYPQGFVVRHPAGY